ncbi:MAG: hypothetical protein OXQ32_11050 [bacterium]|nr:hypothetical protein [bacterium]
MSDDHDHNDYYHYSDDYYYYHYWGAAGVFEWVVVGSGAGVAEFNR